MTASKGILLRDFRPRPLLVTEAHIPERARFPVIDAHNHLFGEMPAPALVEVMDRVGVATWLNVSGNAVLPYVNNTYTIRRVPIDDFLGRYVRPYPKRFACFTMAEFAQWDDACLLTDDDFAERCIATLVDDVRKGACGLKITKELGLRFTDRAGRMLAVDDARLFPVWARAGQLGVPVLMHISDPIGFFLPKDDPTNEHLPVLEEFPGWSFHGACYSKWELLEQRNRLIAAHPKTTFILPHVANLPEDLGVVGRLLDRFANVFIDISARLDELGRQPYSARDFLIRHQDRVLFGVDMPVTPEIYRCHFRFLETRDEYFETPDYVGRWGKSRWRVHGLGLPVKVLEKLYRKNAFRAVPGLPR
ncbi:MAG: hypothetical protein A3K19_01395 [Lentisphaerae bacterium RIFOXYB12_FULL_65_16]|nr:MAG: hypothetical protein A3K18_22750 [Lentisphaerae bacterium RIFOXYA12_64_32]OGV92798.1 MAG: hypothetical protein A3K19_01395 [Lentisphaerae bacterium RIFOXYB12_FULL_65_16]